MLPLGAVRARPAHRLIDGLGPDAERAGQRSPRLVEDRDPEVGDPHARATDGAPATAGGHLRRRDARLPADPGDDGGEREAPGARRHGRFDALSHGFDEGARPENPFIPEVRLPAAAQRGDRLPAPETPEEAAPLEVRAPALGRASVHERSVGRPRPPRGGAELGENLRRGLPGARDPAQQGAMPGPRIPGQGPHVRYHLRAQWVEVQIPDELQQIRLRLHHDGLVPVLEEVADAAMAAVEAPAYPVKRLRMLRAKGRWPVRTSRWA